MWIYDHFSNSINITEIGLYTIYSDSTRGAAALLPDNAAALVEFALPEHILLFTACLTDITATSTLHHQLGHTK